jgi:hypothetical protein
VSNTFTVTVRVLGGDEKGSLKYETVKYGRESQVTRTPGRLSWQDPSAHTEINSQCRILLYPPCTDHAQKTQFHCCVAQTMQETSHVITISPVHWRADCYLATCYKHSSYCCMRVSRDVYRAAAWQCVDVRILFRSISDVKSGKLLRSVGKGRALPIRML